MIIPNGEVALKAFNDKVLTQDVQNKPCKLPFSDQIHSASSRAAESQSTDKSLAKESTPDR